MEIISGQNVDLITPFPLTESHRVFGWNHCYRSLTDNDDIPAEKEQFTRHIEQVLQACVSFGVIDKNKLTNQNHEAPLVGIGVYEPGAGRGGYLHFACARKAFKMGLIDEAGEMMVNFLFERLPDITRLGAYTNDRNSPAKALSRRLGFKFEGLCEDMVLKGGEPQNIAYFGLTRRNWENKWTSIQSSISSSSTSETVEPPLDKDLATLDKA